MKVASSTLASVIAWYVEQVGAVSAHLKKQERRLRRSPTSDPGYHLHLEPTRTSPLLISMHRTSSLVVHVTKRNTGAELALRPVSLARHKSFHWKVPPCWWGLRLAPTPAGVSAGCKPFHWGALWAQAQAHSWPWMRPGLGRSLDPIRLFIDPIRLDERTDSLIRTHCLSVSPAPVPATLWNFDI